MLKTRVIPCLTIKDLRLVKSIRFSEHRNIGSYIAAARVFNARNVDEMLIQEIAKECFMPLTVGGGVKTLEDISLLLRLGADKVSINSAAVLDPEFIGAASAQFGSQCIVVSIDARFLRGGYEVFTHGGSRNTGLSPALWAKEAEIRGAGEIFLTSIDHDGCMDGYDLSLVKSVVEAVSLPVIASGGAGNEAHCTRVVKEGGASAVSAASIFQYTEITPNMIKEELAKSGVEVRL